MVRWHSALPYLLPVVMLIGLGGCSDDDDSPPTANGGTTQQTGSLTLTIDFAGTVSDTSPIIVEVKDDKLAEPTRRVVVPSGDTTITIENIPTTDDYVVALYHDENNDGEFDELDEPFVFYNADEPDQAVGALGEATVVTILADQVVDIGTISFAESG